MHAAAIKYAIPKLSDITIDVDKDWNARRIANLGTPNSDDDAISRGLIDRYSIDYGKKWTDLGVIASSAIYAMAYLGSGVAILGDSAKHVYRSTDYGATWIDLGVIASGRIYAMAYLGNGVAVLGDDWGHVYRSIDYGATWADLGEVSGSNINAMAYLGNGVAILGDSLNHVHRSIDYGATWIDLGVVAADTIYAMAYLGSGVAILGDNAKHVYRSTDYGATWIDLGVVAGSYINAMAYLGNGVAILGDGVKHVYCSTDYGATWIDLGVVSGGSIHAMAYLGNGVAVLGDGAWHVWRSTSAFQLSNFNPNQFDKLFQFGCLGAITPNGTSYLAPGNGATQANEIKARVPRPGILKNLYVWQRVASGLAGRTDIYTVRVNGVDTTITCTLNNAITGSDITHSKLVAAGGQISIKLVSNDAADTSADVVATLELT